MWSQWAQFRAHCILQGQYVEQFGVSKGHFWQRPNVITGIAEGVQRGQDVGSRSPPYAQLAQPLSLPSPEPPVCAESQLYVKLSEQNRRPCEIAELNQQ